MFSYILSDFQKKFTSEQKSFVKRVFLGMERDPPKGVPPDDERYLMTLRVPKKSTVQVFRMIC